MFDCIMKIAGPRGRGFACALLLWPAAAIWAAAPTSLEQLCTARAKLAARPHRVIFDNDGMDAQFLSTHTPAALLDVRTRPLLDTRVTTVFYCSRSSGLGVFTHNTRVGEVFTSRVGRYHKNATADFIAQGTDPLRIVTDFCRANGLEVFWTLRMNDCHDVVHRPDKPYPAFSKLKAAHPDWLMGRWDKRPPYGAWSAFDFAQPQVRQLAVDCVAEVCRNYDVDGVHLDFFRHLGYFRRVCMGGQATAEELGLMTDLIRRIRRVTEQEGLRRGRPILLAARVPDSVEFCRGIGLDVERWLKDGLLDLLVVGEWRFNPWERSVALGHRYGAQVVAGLSEGRVRGERGPYHRQSDAAYRGRSAAAWAAGCDGLYLFNLYDARRKFLSQVHDPQLLRRLEQQVFLTVRPYNDAGRYLKGALQYAHKPLLTPSKPWVLKPGQPRTADLEVGDPAGRPGRLMLLLTDPAAPVSVSLNGRELKRVGVEQAWTRFDAPAGLVKPGLNAVRVEVSREAGLRRTFTPEDIHRTWALRGANVKGQAFEELRPDGLFIADRSSTTGHYHYRSYGWPVSPGGRAAVAVVVRHIRGFSSLAFADGRHEDRLMIYPDRIQMQHSGLRYAMDTTDRFHTYRVEIEGADYRVFVDGRLRIDGRGAYRGKASGGRTMVLLGAATSTHTGEAIWRNVTIETAAAGLQDMVLVLPETN